MIYSLALIADLVSVYAIYGISFPRRLSCRRPGRREQLIHDSLGSGSSSLSKPN